MEKERARFVIEAELSGLSHAELCRRDGISRPTGYKWIERYGPEGLKGLEDRSQSTISCMFMVASDVEGRHDVQ